MSAICLMDTSVFVEILRVPGMDSHHAEIVGDLSIIHDWRRLCEQNPQRRVTIWSLDQHLAGYDRPAP